MSRKQNEIAKLEAQLAQLRKEVEQEQKIPAPSAEEADLANFLHEHLCTANHTDGCSWGYEEANEWYSGTHLQYLKKARRLLKLASVNIIKKVVIAVKEYEGWE